MKLSDYVIDFIANCGVEYIFTVVGGGSMHLDESLGNSHKVSYICNLHEQASAIAAQAYGHSTNNLGAALVTTGPGGTNTITGVAAAWIDSIPMIIISGQVKRSALMDGTGLRQRGSQEVDITSIVKPITKYAIKVMDPLTIRYHLEKAVYYAKHGRRGPVWVDIPLDVQAIDIEPDQLVRFDPNVENQCVMDTSIKQDTEKVFEMLKQAKRPIIFAGYGVQAAESEKEFLQLIDRLKVPVILTWKAIGLLPDDHPLYVGRPGSIGQRGANFSLQNSDLVICIGTRLDPDQVGFNYQLFAREAKKIIVDIDAAEIKKLEMNIDCQIIADAGDFIRSMLEIVTDEINNSWIEWLEKCKDWSKKYPVVLNEYWSEKKYVNMYVLNDILSDLAHEDDVIVPGSSGPCANILLQVWKVKRGQKFIFAPGLGSMGFGLPMSIGACVANGRKNTICVNGDGGFQCNIQELETVVREKLPIKFFILNNNGYGSIMAMQRNYFNGHYVGSNPDSGLTFPDILRIAHAYKIPSIKLSNHKSLKEKIEKYLYLPGPFIFEVIVDPNQVQMPRVTSVLKSDGSLVSKPLEDLWPFLDRDEFYSNMIITPIPE